MAGSARRRSIFQTIGDGGCLAFGLYVLALFFAAGALVSFLNVDMMRTAQAVILMGLSLGGGIWFAQKHKSSLKR